MPLQTQKLMCTYHYAVKLYRAAQATRLIPRPESQLCIDLSRFGYLNSYICYIQSLLAAKHSWAQILARVIQVFWSTTLMIER